jgi:hypothetical protein
MQGFCVLHISKRTLIQPYYWEDYFGKAGKSVLRGLLSSLQTSLEVRI